MLALKIVVNDQRILGNRIDRQGDRYRFIGYIGNEKVFSETSTSLYELMAEINVPWIPRLAAELLPV